MSFILLCVTIAACVIIAAVFTGFTVWLYPAYSRSRVSREGSYLTKASLVLGLLIGAACRPFAVIIDLLTVEDNQEVIQIIVRVLDGESIDEEL